MKGGRYCRGCGYDLAGIAAAPSACCPECARQFDPADPSTFDRLPRRSRRRRLLVRLVIAAVILALVAALFPRGYAVGRLVINPAGGPAAEYVRIQPAPPTWLRRLVSVRYPGWTRRTEPLPGAAPGFKLSINESEFTLKGIR